MLTADQMESYRSNGFLVVPDVLDRTEIDELRAVTEKLIDRSRSVSTHTDVFDIAPEHSSDVPRVRRIKWPNLVDPVYDATLRHEGILEIVAQLVGPDIRYQETKLNVKAAHSGEPVEWHQDWAFIPHTNDDLLVIGIPLDDMTIENGCLRVVPGSHRTAIFDHHREGMFVGAVAPADFASQADAIVPIEAPAGGISIHHVRILHGSAPNPSNRARRLLLLELGAADAWPIMGIDDWDEFNSRIIRGAPVQEPRMEPVPVRVPLPRKAADSIYGVQEDAARSAFA